MFKAAASKEWTKLGITPDNCLVLLSLAVRLFKVTRLSLEFNLYKCFQILYNID